MAAIHGRHSLIEGLVAEGAEVDVEDYNRGTPLHHACATGRKECANLLVTLGADPTKQDKNVRYNAPSSHPTPPPFPSLIPYTIVVIFLLYCHVY